MHIKIWLENSNFWVKYIDGFRDVSSLEHVCFKQISPCSFVTENTILKFIIIKLSYDQKVFEFQAHLEFTFRSAEMILIVT